MPAEFDTECLYCKTVNEVHTDVTGEADPIEGDASLCWQCGLLSIYNKDLSLRKPTVPELITALRDEGFRTAVLTRIYVKAEAL